MKHGMRKAGCLISLAVCLGVLAGCSAGGKESKQLERNTALELLRERSGEILHRSSYLERRWTVDHALVVLVAEVPTAYGQGLLEFCNQLTAVGVLRRLANKDESVTRDSAFGTDHWIEKRYYFEGINHPDAKFVGFGNPMSNWATFRVNTLSFSRVTGIRQNGNRAQVDVEISSVPNDMYKRLSTAMARTREKLGNPQFQLKTPLHKLADVTRTSSNTYTFVLYDDGWRVEM